MQEDPPGKPPPYPSQIRRLIWHFPEEQSESKVQDVPGLNPPPKSSQIFLVRWHLLEAQSESKVQDWGPRAQVVTEPNVSKIIKTRIRIVTPSLEPNIRIAVFENHKRRNYVRPKKDSGIFHSPVKFVDIRGIFISPGGHEGEFFSVML